MLFAIVAFALEIKLAGKKSIVCESNEFEKTPPAAVKVNTSSTQTDGLAGVNVIADGTALTFTVNVAVFSQIPADCDAVKVYVVVAVGLNVQPVELFPVTPVAGDHTNVS